MVTYYKNKRNFHKFLEIHNDGHYYNSVRQFMQWGTIKIFTGDGKLHRIKASALKELLKDYEVILYK